MLGEQVISDRFIPGRAAPLSIVTDAESAEPVTTAFTTGLGDAHPGDVRDGRLGAGIQAGTDALGGLPEVRAVLRCRRRTRSPACGARHARRRRSNQVLIGGEVAEAYDTREALKRDTWLIVPIGLGADPDHPDRAVARDRDAAVRDRHRDPVVRVRAGRQLVIFTQRDGPARQRPHARAVRVHLPGRARRRLQRVPARPDPRGARSLPGHEGRRRRRARADRRRHHQRRASCSRRPSAC